MLRPTSLAIRSLSALRAIVVVFTVLALGVGLAVFDSVTPAHSAPINTADGTNGSEIVELPEAESNAAPIDLAFAFSARGYLPATTVLEATARITNRTDTEVPASLIRVEFFPQPLESTAELTEWLDGAKIRSSAYVLGRIPVPVLSSQSIQVVETSIAAPDLNSLPAGIYPVRATAEFESQSESQGTNSPTTELESVVTQTLLIVGSAPATPTAVVVPITATPLRGTLLTSAELDTLTQPQGNLHTILEAVALTDVAIAVDPAIIAAIRVLGAAAPESALEWLETLESRRGDTYLLQWADADPVVQLQAGLAQLLQPLSLDPFMDAANFPNSAGGIEVSPTPTSTPTPGPTQTAEPTPTPTQPADIQAPSLPTTNQLGYLNSATGTLIWPRAVAADTNVPQLAEFVTAGTAENALAPTVNSEVPWIMVSADAVAASVGFTGAPTTGVISGTPALVFNPGPSRAFSAAAQSTNMLDYHAAMAQGMALVQLQGNKQTQPVLISLDRGTDGMPALGDLLTEIRRSGSNWSITDIQAAAGLDPVGIELLDQPDTTAEIQQRANALTQLLEDEASVDSFSSILAEPIVLQSPERLRLLRVISAGLHSEDFDVTFAAQQEHTAELLGSVTVQPPSRVQLISAGSDLPVWVRNTLPWPVTVILEARPVDARLEVERFTEIEIQPDSNTRVRVPIKARVGSGEVRVSFSLSSTSGNKIGTSEVAHVTVRADWETIGISIFGGLIIVLLTLGVLRTVRKRAAHPDGEVVDE